MGVVAAINQVISVLQADAGLTGFLANFSGKTLTVTKAFRQRIEINVAELPIIIVTRPTVDSQADRSNAGWKDNTVCLYFGFHCEDRELAAELVIEGEELLENALMKDMTLGGTACQVLPGQAVNDEGNFHPVYFIVKEMHLHTEVNWGD